MELRGHSIERRNATGEDRTKQERLKRKGKRRGGNEREKEGSRRGHLFPFCSGKGDFPLLLSISIDPLTPHIFLLLPFTSYSLTWRYLLTPATRLVSPGVLISFFALIFYDPSMQSTMKPSAPSNYPSFKGTSAWLFGFTAR